MDVKLMVNTTASKNSDSALIEQSDSIGYLKAYMSMHVRITSSIEHGIVLLRTGM